MRPPASLVVLLGGASALLLGGLITTLLVARRPVASFSPGSPEATVSLFLRLLQDGKVDEAYDLSEVQGPPGHPVDLGEFHRRYDRWSERPHDVSLVRSNTTGDRATVTVQISTMTDGLLVSGERRQEMTFILERRSGRWIIVDAAPLYW